MEKNFTKSDKETIFTKEKVFEIMGYFRMSYDDVMNSSVPFFLYAIKEINRSKMEKILLAQLPVTCCLEILGYQTKAERNVVYESIFK